MPLGRRLSELVRRDTGTIHYECRHCGRNLRDHLEACPECGGSVAVYEL
jgi:primosomal protein N'